MRGHARQTQPALPAEASTSQLRRRNLTSTMGVQRNISNGGICRIAAIREMPSTGTPDLLKRKGRAVQIKPMYIPKGRISRPKAQGRGQALTVESRRVCGPEWSRWLAIARAPGLNLGILAHSPRPERTSRTEGQGCLWPIARFCACTFAILDATTGFAGS